MADCERDLERLLRNLAPVLSNKRYAFETAAGTQLGDDTFALVREDEGLTSIRETRGGEWARISLGIHSSLEVVGLTAVLTKRLAEAGVSVNVVAGAFHDHFFVPWDRREEAFALLRPPSA